MTQFVFANFFESELVSGATASDTSIFISPTDAKKLPIIAPGQESRLVLWDGQLPPEIVGCILNPQTGTLLVNRGQENTTSQAWAAGTQIRCSVTAEIINTALQAYFDFTTVLNASFLKLAGGTLTGPLILNGNPTTPLGAATKQYVDSIQGGGLPLTGGTMLGAINMNSNPLLNVPDPTSPQNPATKNYVDTTFAPLASPVFTGAPQAPTQAPADNSTKLATTAYVDAAASVGAAAWSTGDVKLTLKIAADAGWLMCDDSSIGNTGSGASHAGAQFQNLFTLLWNNVTDTWAPVNGGRGVSATADWTANKRIALTQMLGRTLGFAGNGVSLTPRPLGATTGEETHLLTTPEMPSHGHPLTDPGHHHILDQSIYVLNGPGAASAYGLGGTPKPVTDTVPTGITIGSTGGGGAHNNMQPTTFLNAMIKI
jgi:microcystin-dependent protein